MLFFVYLFIIIIIILTIFFYNYFYLFICLFIFGLLHKTTPDKFQQASMPNKTQNIMKDDVNLGGEKLTGYIGTPHEIFCYASCYDKS